jgi:carboxyl-terminal processing protease
MARTASRALFAPTFLRKTGIASMSLAAVMTLVACGGGGGGGSSDFSSTTSSANSGWVAGVYKNSAEFDNLCAAPRSGVSQYTGKAFPDKKGTSIDEKNFLRSWSYETYLWFNEIPDVNPDRYQTPQEYFEILKTKQYTSSGNLKDNFHFSEPTEDAEAWDLGVNYGYGIHLKVYSSVPPRQYYVTYVDANSPAALAGINRGAKLLKIDSYDLINDTSSDGINGLTEGLFPTKLGAAHNFEIQDAGATTTRKVTLQSAEVATSPVLLTKALTTSTGTVGYVVFNSHVEKAQDQWVKAVDQLKQSAATDLVLDLRYNTGGLLSIASQVSYMVGGQNIQGDVFYKQIQNSKQPVLEPFPFLKQGRYGEYKNTALPTLDLKRVYILSSNSTCSASEAIINGLRGANIQVYLVGDTTCGKPYGFFPEENCGTTYYTIQLKGANAKNFGEYSDGFVPSPTDNNETMVKGCRVQDDLNHLLGDESEALLAAALNLRATGVCSSQATGRLLKTNADFVDGQVIEKEVRKLLILD